MSHPHHTGPQRYQQYPPQQQYGQQPSQSWERDYQPSGQWNDQYGAPQVPRRRQAPPPAPKKKWPYVLGGVAAVIVLGSAINGGGKSSPTVGVQPSGSGVVNAQPADQAKSLPAQAPAAAAAPAGPGTAMGAGTYEVGPDIVPGRYKTKGSGREGFFGSCYFQRSRNDSGEFDSIISNDFFQGPGSVTVKKGEFLKLTGDCEWAKQ